MIKQLALGAAKVAVGVSAVGAVALSTSSPVHAATRHEAPIGYHYDVTTASGYHFRDLRHEDGRPGVWNAAQRGNGQGVSFVTTSHPRMTIHLGVNDRAQGGDGNGVVAWRAHGVVRVDNEVVYRRHGYVAEVDTTVRTHGRTFYVIASAIWK